MFFSESDVTEFIEDNDVKFIRLTFCDTLWGNEKHCHFAERTAESDCLRHPVQCNRTAGGTAPELIAETGMHDPFCFAVATAVRQSCSVLLQSDDHGWQAVCRGLAAKSPQYHARD